MVELIELEPSFVPLEQRQKSAVASSACTSFEVVERSSEPFEASGIEVRPSAWIREQFEVVAVEWFEFGRLDKLKSDRMEAVTLLSIAVEVEVAFASVSA